MGATGPVLVERVLMAGSVEELMHQMASRPSSFPAANFPSPSANFTSLPAGIEALPLECPAGLGFEVVVKSPGAPLTGLHDPAPHADPTFVEHRKRARLADASFAPVQKGGLRDDALLRPPGWDEMPAPVRARSPSKRKTKLGSSRSKDTGNAAATARPNGSTNSSAGRARLRLLLCSLEQLEAPETEAADDEKRVTERESRWLEAVNLRFAGRAEPPARS
jgi:hypothetical protein